MNIQTVVPRLISDMQILTSAGYKKISDLCNKNIDIWNGCDWDNVSVRYIKKINSCIVIELSDGFKIKCAPDHIICIDCDNITTTVSADKLMINDKCIRLQELPVVVENFYTLVENDIDEPPINCNVRMQLGWLCKYIDKDAGCLQITSQDKEWLRRIQLMSHCLGTTPFIVSSPRGFHLRFCSKDARSLIEQLSLPCNKKISDYCFVELPDIRIASIAIEFGNYDVYTFI